jgi:hypothetical protein
MTGPNPTDRGNLGTKRHVIKDKRGVPLSVYPQLPILMT